MTDGIIKGTPIEFSKHAKRQLAERNLSEEAVTDCLEKPQQVLYNSRGKGIAHKIFEKEGKDFLMRVIFLEESNRRKVVTVYITSKIHKYWRRDK